MKFSAPQNKSTFQKQSVWYQNCNAKWFRSSIANSSFKHIWTYTYGKQARNSWLNIAYVDFRVISIHINEHYIWWTWHLTRSHRSQPERETQASGHELQVSVLNIIKSYAASIVFTSEMWQLTWVPLKGHRKRVMSVEYTALALIVQHCITLPFVFHLLQNSYSSWHQNNLPKIHWYLHIVLN